MASFYLHIPFCRRACHYCDFHFSTKLDYIDRMVVAMTEEMRLRKTDWQEATFNTLYLGGGTPSVLSKQQLLVLKNAALMHYSFTADFEFTLEVNPEDVNEDQIMSWKKAGVNRLSIGLQSFEDRDLKLMNRAHSSEDSLRSLELAVNHFDRVSVDVIYGIPGQSDELLQKGINKVVDIGATHVSAYALTVEPKTALASYIEKELIPDIDEEQAERQFLVVLDTLMSKGFEHYEISNFALPGHYSINNSSYWKGISYVGIGPSAHGFDGKSRYWNVAQNHKYMNAVERGVLDFESEELTTKDRYNEFVMTSLRTQWGVSYQDLEAEFGTPYLNYFKMMITPFLLDALLFEEEGVIRATRKGKFLIDGIASELFMVELKTNRT